VEAGSAERNADVLYEVISTVASSLELDEVLRAVVRLLSDASGVHACFVYLLDESGERLELAAASPPYEHLAGEVCLERGEGLAWWVVERDEPAFIPERLLEDPRVKYVPELDEERFQSLVSVPVHGRGGRPIGVVSAHTEAPRAFARSEVDFLLSSATLVAGAIENARLYEEMRQRVHELEGLTALAETVAEAETQQELLDEVAARAHALLGAEAASLYLLEPASEELVLRATSPPGVQARERVGLGELGPELSRGGRVSRIAVPLVASDELLGLLVARGSRALDLARAVASQTAVGIKKIQLIERLTEKNLIKDFFEDLAGGRLTADLEGRAARLGCDLELPYLVLAAQPASDALERGLAAALPRSLFDRREDALRALLRVPPGGAERAVEIVRRVHAEAAPDTVVGLSSTCSGAATFGEGFEEAKQAVLGTAVLERAPAVTVFEELGAYKYLLRIALEGGVRDATVDAVTRIADYDAQRGTSLLATLEEFLRRRGNISATSEALYVHQNTLRQRLRRLGELSGIDLRRDDWLVVELAVKMVLLRRALGAPAGSDTSAA
jgi:GAF domain-containing protein